MMGLRTMITGAAAVGLVALALATPGVGPSPAAPPAAPAPVAPAAPSFAASLPPSSAGFSAAQFRPGVQYDWPLRPEPEVVRDFEPPDQVWAPGHRGVDLGSVAGAPVHAAAEGVVAFAGRVVDRPVVSIDHPDGIRTTYEPVDPAVRAGEHVVAGAVIGHLTQADTGPHCDSDCLHWGARTGPDEYLDPLLLLGGGPVVIRLYPLAP